MRNALRYLSLVLLISVVGVLSDVALAKAASGSDEEIFVGRITYVEGNILRYIEEEQDWVATVKDTPFGLEDALYSGVDAKAEFIMPNRTWLRIGDNTQVQLISLNPDATTVDVASGLARLYNKSDDAIIKVTTPYGYVVAPGDTIFDLYVGDESLEIIAVRGSIDFVHEGTGGKYEIRDGSFSIIADQKETAKGNGMVDSAWDDWNYERDTLWEKRLQSRSYSVNYLPEPLHDDAYVLDESGRWERVYYEGEYREMWRPTRVEPGWRPFTVGRWSVYYGDHCWVPYETFGYVTHHYGSWIYVQSSRFWYWVPPVSRVAVGVPLFSIRFGWYPGRVGWIHSGPSIGWVPLGPQETYYGHRPWGHRTVIYNQTTVVNINIGNYRFLDEAVVVHRDHFYRGSSYTPYIQRNVSRDILINDYRPTTIINNTVINNFNSDRRRFTYSDVEVSRKPHAMVVDRIEENRKTRRDSGRISKDRIERDLTRISAVAEPESRMELRAPRLANKIVDTDKVDKPLNTLTLEKKEIKSKERERRVVDDQRRGAKRQDESGQVRQKKDSQESEQRIRSPREGQKRESGEDAADAVQSTDKRRPPIARIKPDQVEGTDRQEEKKELRSPRDVRQKRDVEQREADEPQKRPMPPKSSRFKEGDQQEALQQEQAPEQKGDQEPRQRMKKDVDQNRDADKRNDTQRVQSPRDVRDKGKEQQLGRQQDEARKQKEDQARQEQAVQPRKQREDQARQEQAVQQRKQREDQGRQEQAVQQRKQREDQARQEQAVQQRKQREDQARQEQAVQQRKQREDQGRQEQAVQQRKQKEDQARQEQAVQQRKQREDQARQEQAVQQRKQKEDQARQEQAVQQRKQKEDQARQEQEVQQRKQRQQPEQVQKPQEQQQQALKKKKKKEEEEAAAAAAAAAKGGPGK